MGSMASSTESSTTHSPVLSRSQAYCAPRARITSTCLTQAQVGAFEKVYQGPRNPVTGQEIYPGYSLGTELGWGSNTTGPLPSTAQSFFKFMVFNDPNWNFQTLNFNTDITTTDAKFAATLDAVDPDLRAFKQRGGKILQSHLWSSTTHAARRSIEYYDQVVSFMNANEEATQGNGGNGVALTAYLRASISAQRSNSIVSSWRRAERQQRARYIRFASVPGALGRAGDTTRLDPGIAFHEWRSRSHAAALPLSSLRRLSGQRQH